MQVHVLTQQQGALACWNRFGPISASEGEYLDNCVLPSFVARVWGRSKYVYDGHVSTYFWPLNERAPNKQNQSLIVSSVYPMINWVSVYQTDSTETH